MDFNDKGIVYLRNAIVEQAARDYLKTITALNSTKYHGYTRSKLEDEKKMIEDFFLSQDFDMYELAYSGRYYLNRLNKMVKEKQKKFTLKRGYSNGCKNIS